MTTAPTSVSTTALPGSGLYPVYAGFDKDLQAVAVLVDLKLLDGAEPR